MDWHDVFSPLYEMLGGTFNASPPAETETYTNLEPVRYQSSDRGTLFCLEDSVSESHINYGLSHGLSHQDPPPLDFIQDQCFPYQMPVHEVTATASAADSHLAAPDLIVNQVIRLPEGFLTKEMEYERSDPSTFVAPSAKAKKRKFESKQNKDQPYVKRPPNAFMIFIKEQRPNIVAELGVTNNATVNAELGQRWKAMTHAEQAKYYKKAAEASKLHYQQHPNWTSKENYGKHRKRDRRKAAK